MWSRFAVTCPKESTATQVGMLRAQEQIWSLLVQRLNGQAKETNLVLLMSILQENQCLIRKDDHEKKKFAYRA